MRKICCLSTLLIIFLMTNYFSNAYEWKKLTDEDNLMDDVCPIANNNNQVLIPHLHGRLLLFNSEDRKISALNSIGFYANTANNGDFVLANTISPATNYQPFIYKSYDFGHTWTFVHKLNPGDYLSDLCIINPDTLLIFSMDYTDKPFCTYTFDGGNHIITKPMNAGTSVNSTIVNNSELLMSRRDGYILKTNDFSLSSYDTIAAFKAGKNFYYGTFTRAKQSIFAFCSISGEYLEFDNSNNLIKHDSIDALKNYNTVLCKYFDADQTYYFLVDSGTHGKIFCGKDFSNLTEILTGDFGFTNIFMMKDNSLVAVDAMGNIYVTPGNDINTKHETSVRNQNDNNALSIIVNQDKIIINSENAINLKNFNLCNYLGQKIAFKINYQSLNSLELVTDELPTNTVLFFSCLDENNRIISKKFIK